VTLSLAPPWLSARVHDVEQPRHPGMPIWPGHRPGYFYALHRRHRDTHRPDDHGPRVMPPCLHAEETAQ
jgi:hypothetical protein